MIVNGKEVDHCPVCGGLFHLFACPAFRSFVFLVNDAGEVTIDEEGDREYRRNRLEYLKKIRER